MPEIVFKSLFIIYYGFGTWTMMNFFFRILAKRNTDVEHWDVAGIIMVTSLVTAIIWPLTYLFKASPFIVWAKFRKRMSKEELLAEALANEDYEKAAKIRDKM